VNSAYIGSTRLSEYPYAEIIRWNDSRCDPLFIKFFTGNSQGYWCQSLK